MGSQSLNRETSTKLSGRAKNKLLKFLSKKEERKRKMKIFSRVTILLVLVATSVKPQGEDPDGDDRIRWDGSKDLASNSTSGSKATPGQNLHVLGVNYTGPGLGGAGIIAVVLGVLLLLLIIGIVAVFTTCGSNVASAARWAVGHCLARLDPDVDPEAPAETESDDDLEREEIKGTKRSTDIDEKDENNENSTETGTGSGRGRRPLGELLSRLPQPVQDLIGAFKRPNGAQE